MADEVVEEAKMISEDEIDEAMNIFECIATRRSIRKFMDSDVPMEMLGTIIDAGRYAPSAGNAQDYRFVIIRNKDLIGKVSEACMQQLWMAQAPVLVVVCSDFEKLKMYYGIRGERFYSVQNCAATVENMLLAAHGLGLGSCWVSAFDEDALRSAIGIPGNVRPMAVLPFGFPDEVVPVPMKLSIENVCYFESYGNRVWNIDKVMINPDVFGRMSKAGTSIVEAGKTAFETYQKHKKK
ncbi:nitroreductase family protein [archaeon]|jgi:nitroreductase|nr:nitroreductase family protein [archaeon]MBT4647803.1 nitroreductase family protein [archaeon]MBT6821664.1 nitroreductase family protein [archaeon]MBT7393069.1 nitroreductase family protein [archaeon]